MVGSLTVLLLFLLSASLPGSQESSSSQALPEAIHRAREAYLAYVQGVKSAHGVGTWTHYVTQNERKTLVASGRLETYTKGDKYNITLHIEKAETDGKRLCSRRIIIICDGSGPLFASRLWDTERGSTEGYVDYTVGRLSQIFDFEWDVGNLAIVDIDKVANKHLKKERNRTVEVVDLSGGGHRAKVPINDLGSYWTFDFHEKDGYNVSRLEVFRDQEAAIPSQVDIAVWKKSETTWFIKSLARRIDYSLYNMGIVEWFMEYDSFDPTYNVPDDRFTLEALQLKDNSRILEFREGEQTKVLITTKPQHTPQDRLDQMVTEIRSLPTRDEVHKTQAQPAVRTPLALWVLLSVLFLSALFVIVWRWRRSAPNAGG